MLSYGSDKRRVIPVDDRIKLAEFVSKLSKEIEITVNEIYLNKDKGRLNNLIIAQISDLHANKWNLELIEHTVELINKIKPDILTMTGDAICNGEKFIPNLINCFKEINAKYGKFACLGNHDHSDGHDSLKIQEAYKKSDFQILINNSDKINIDGESLYIAGADDIELGDQNISKMTENIPENAASVFLVHNPLNFREFTKFNPNLVISGHTHGGQLYSSQLGFLYKYILQTKYISGLYNLNKSSLYVNRGIGTALIAPVIFNKKFIINTPRINSKPEISLFVLNS